MSVFLFFALLFSILVMFLTIRFLWLVPNSLRDISQILKKNDSYHDNDVDEGHDDDDLD